MGIREPMRSEAAQHLVRTVAVRAAILLVTGAVVAGVITGPVAPVIGVVSAAAAGFFVRALRILYRLRRPNATALLEGHQLVVRVANAKLGIWVTPRMIAAARSKAALPEARAN